MIYLPKKGCLNIIYRNTTHILDMPCCHKHQQQRHHRENTKICVFIDYMYVEILFPLTKIIATMFERVTTHGQTIMQRVTITSMRYHTHYHMRYHAFFLSLTWGGHNATCYHNFNLLSHTIPNIFTQLSMVWGYL